MSLSAELAATCSALGYFDERTQKYYAESNPLETVKDLIRYLRRDDENHDARRQLGETNVLKTDLLPLLKGYWQDNELFDVLLRLLMNLTTPPFILWNEEIPTDKNTRNYYMQIEEHLRNYKLSFADDALWAVLSSRLSQVLEVDASERPEDDGLIVERILILIRNILFVAIDTAVERRSDNDVNTHDQVAWAMHKSGLLDILLYISSSSGEQSYHRHVLEILSFLLKEQNPTELGKTELERNHAEKVKSEAELMALRHKETISKQQKARIFTGVRHSRFGGTYVVKSMKSIGDNELIYHKPLSRLDTLNFDADKKKPKTPKNRLPIHMESSERRSAFSVRLFLKEFCVEFLKGAYNTTMFHVKEQLVRAKSQSYDASYYLWAIKFFMEFNRSYKFEVKLISETLSIQIFHFVQQHMENYFDMMQSDKKKLRAWSGRLHYALSAYKELLLTLCFMDKSPDGTVRDSSQVIKSNIYYVVEYRELVLTLLLTFDELKMSDMYLNDLIETQHVFLKSFETFCKDGNVIVQKKSKAKRKKKKAPIPVEVPDNNLESQWNEAVQQISLILETNSNIPSDVVPFDAASDVPIDEQKSETMISIQRKLRCGEYENAIGLLRAAREVWPENDSFGNSQMSPEEEFMSLRDIFMEDLGENSAVPQQPIYDVNDEEEEEEDDDHVGFSEGDLKFEDFVKRMAHPKIVRAAGLALSRFETNSILTNHCIIKLLHRIAFDCKMYVLLFQISVFISFQKIFEFKQLPQYKELVRFATFIVRKFIQISENNKKVYMEALFWKSSKDAYDIEYGYGSYQEKSKAASLAWTEEEEDEVRRLFMEHKEKEIEEDVVDWILANLIDNSRTRRGLLKKMKELYLLADYKGPKKSRNTSRLPQQWSQEEMEELTELYEQFKEAMDPLGCIIDRLSVPRPKNRVIEKLLVLGLIQDRKEVRKKRLKGATKSNKGKGGRGSPQRSASESESDTSEDEVPARPQGSINPSRGGATGVGGRNKNGKKGKRDFRVNVSRKRLAEITLGLEQAGMREALDWLKECFADVIEDFEEDGDEGIPIVPIMDYSVAAMEKQEFLDFLEAMGVMRPSNEQEIYWRIPSEMTLDILKSYHTLLNEALEGNLIIPEDDGTPALPTNDEETHEITEEIPAMVDDNGSTSNVNNGTRNDHAETSDDDEDIFEKLKRTNPMSEATIQNKSEEYPRIMNRSKRPRFSSSDENFNGDDLIAEERRKKKKKKQIKPKKIKSGQNDKKQKKEKSKTDEGENSKKKATQKPTAQVFKSREFVGSDDDTDSDEESARKLQEHYENLLK